MGNFFLYFRLCYLFFYQFQYSQTLELSPVCPPIVDDCLDNWEFGPAELDAEVWEAEGVPGGGGESAASLAGVGCWMYRSRTWWQISSRSAVSKLSTYISHHCSWPSSFRFSQSFTLNHTEYRRLEIIFILILQINPVLCEIKTTYFSLNYLLQILKVLPPGTWLQWLWFQVPIVNRVLCTKYH